MRGCIEYDAIADQGLEEVLKNFIQLEKIIVEEAVLDDFAINMPLGKLKLTEFNYKDCFGYGIYILFDNKRPVYVGMTADNFFHRILSHCNTKQQAFWGWNALLKKIASKLFAKNQNEVTDEELCDALDKLKKFELLRINVLAENWDKVKCKRLERLLMQGFKLMGYEILNTRTGSLLKESFTKPLHKLI